MQQLKVVAMTEKQTLRLKACRYFLLCATALGTSQLSAQEVDFSFADFSPNHRAAVDSFQGACRSLEDSFQGPGQIALLSSCNFLTSESNMPAILDRIAAEELFALGDSLTIAADQHIGNIRSRIAIVRAGRSNAFDTAGLHLQPTDQRAADKGLHTKSFSLSALNGGGASPDAIEQSALGLFASGTLSKGDIDGQDIQRDAIISTENLTVGLDYRLDEKRVFGAALGIVNDRTDFEGDNGELDMQGLSVNIFASWYEKDQGYADIIAQLGRHDFDLQRRIDLPGQPREFSQGLTDALRTALSMSVGRTFHREATEFGPVLRIAITHASIDGFTETSSNPGGAGTALDVKSHSLTSVRFAVGAEIKRVIGLSRAVLIPSARVEYEVEGETDKGTITATFANGYGNDRMELTGVERSRSAALISIGSTAVFRNGQSAFVSLDARTLDDHVSNRRVRLGYRMQF